MARSERKLEGWETRICQSITQQQDMPMQLTYMTIIYLKKQVI
ncbi:hypothetical protein [Piscirickettsia salmonis]